MQRFMLAVGMIMLMALPPLQAEPGGMGYGGYGTRGQEAAPAAVTISAPVDGAVVAPDERIMVSYKAVPGPNGDHVHVYVDGKRVAVLQQLAGDYELGILAPGTHQISVQIVTNAHQHIGVGQNVSVEVR